MGYDVHTTIPNYKVYPLSEAELDTVAEVEAFMAGRLNSLLEKNGATGMMVKVEITAVLLTQVLAHAAGAAEAMGFKRSQTQQYAIDVVARRAREIYRQGMA